MKYKITLIVQNTKQDILKQVVNWLEVFPKENEIISIKHDEQFNALKFVSDFKRGYSFRELIKLQFEFTKKRYNEISKNKITIEIIEEDLFYLFNFIVHEKKGIIFKKVYDLEPFKWKITMKDFLEADFEGKRNKFKEFDFFIFSIDRQQQSIKIESGDSKTLTPFEFLICQIRILKILLGKKTVLFSLPHSEDFPDYLFKINRYNTYLEDEKPFFKNVKDIFCTKDLINCFKLILK